MVNNVKTESLKVQIVFFFIFSCLIFRREKKKNSLKAFFLSFCDEWRRNSKLKFKFMQQVKLREMKIAFDDR